MANNHSWHIRLRKLGHSSLAVSVDVALVLIDLVSFQETRAWGALVACSHSCHTVVTPRERSATTTATTVTILKYS
jgi:hypothetical protein